MNKKDLSRLLSGFTRFERVAENVQGKDYFVGDICGQYHHLQKALKKVEFNLKKDRLFTTGNFIDYGTDSPKILELLGQPWFCSVLGLHELLLIDAIKSGHYLNWYVQGGHWAFDKKLNLKFNLNGAVKKLKKLPLAMVIEDPKHAPIGIVSQQPILPFTQPQYQAANHSQLFACLTDNQLPTKRSQRDNELTCILTGGAPAKNAWAKGNIVGCNQGAQYLPDSGKLELHKRKKLLKTVEKQSRFIKLV